MTALSCHPATPCDAVRSIDVQARRMAEAMLSLTYTVAGDIERLRVPAPRAPVRADKLWQHTCLEAFVAGTPVAEYDELNFSPSTEWAAYRFSSYRNGMQIVEAARQPSICVERGPGRLTLEAVVDSDLLRALRSDGDLHLALAAVVEEADGTLSYWALAHPPGKPDFHHAAGFALVLPRVARV
jgi:hypothetical protein